MPFFAVGAAIFQGQGHAKRIVVGRQRLFAQAQQIDAGASEIDIHGVQPANRRQGGILVGGNQCAGGDGRDPDTSGNWRGNGGPVQVNTRALQRRLFRLHAGFVLITGRQRIVGILTRYAVVFDQRRVALSFLTVGYHQRLRLLQGGGGFVKGRAIAGRVDLIQRLAGFHHIALGEQAFLNDAAHLRAHFGAE